MNDKAHHRVAVIEDNPDLNGILVDAIAGAGFGVAGFCSVEAYQDAGGDCPHIFLLDLNLPGEDGLSFARRLRGRFPDVGIIMLTARNEMDQRKRGYDNGADVYLTKPGSVDEILGALGALARRLALAGAGSAAMAEPQATTLNRRKLELVGPSGPVSLGVDEAEFLFHCTSDPEGRVSLEQIKAFAKDGATLSKVAIELKVVRIRKKLVAAGLEGRSICSVRNYGYQLLVPLDIVLA